MSDPSDAHRRTVLEAIGAAVIGTGVVTGTAAGASGEAARPARGLRSVVEVTAEHDHESDAHRFDLSRSEVESGWTTLEFDNQTDHTHFTYLAKLPQQALTDAGAHDMTPLAFYVETVTRPFQYYMDTLVPDKEADPGDLSDVYETLFPPWFGDVSYHGGVGLTGGHASSSTTLNLDPGVYTMECYVKNADNDFHSSLGMIEQLDVTGGDSGVPEPESTLEVSLSAAGGLEVGEGLRPGAHTVRVRFEDQAVYSNLVGHDVHLIRLDGGTTAEDVDGWMNWADPTQLISDGGEPATFLGGVQDVLTGDPPSTAYFDVRLEPGDYALVAEVPDPRDNGLMTEFGIPK